MTRALLMGLACALMACGSNDSSQMSGDSTSNGSGSSPSGADSGAASGAGDASASGDSRAPGGGGAADASIPAGAGWHELANTSLKSVCPSYDDIHGVEGCSGVVNDWGSGLADTKRQRLVVWGGGHNGYYGNEVYALDLAATPTTMTLLKDAAHGSAITNLGSCPDAWNDGTPAPRHTGGALEYLPTQDVYHTHGWALPPCGSFGNGLWWFDPNTSAWLSEKNPAGGPQPQAEGSVATEAYDSKTDAIYRLEVNTAEFWRYDPAGNTWSDLKGYGSTCGGTDAEAVIDPGRRAYFCFGNTGFYRISLDPPYTSTQLAGTGCSGVLHNNPGMAFDDAKNAIVMWTGGDDVYVYSPDSDSCTSTTYPGGPGNPAVNGTYGRFRYFPSADAFALVNRWDENAYTLRLAP